MESYEQLLEEAYGKINPAGEIRKFERWEVPAAKSEIIGGKTVISNFFQICSYIRRDCNHVAKFLSKELATQCKFENDRLILNRKIQNSQINEKITFYIHKNVICAECKKPDTELIKQGGFIFMHCLACGAKHSLGRS
ncbi:MAG: translation initiation factor IF-2 subunit beta [Candidatus Pacearchaeota archaeon]